MRAGPDARTCLGPSLAPETRTPQSPSERNERDHQPIPDIVCRKANPETATATIQACRKEAKMATSHLDLLPLQVERVAAIVEC